MAERNQQIIASFTFAEKVLYLLSKNPRSTFRDGFADPWERWCGKDTLYVLRLASPGLLAIMRDKRVLDFGCGDGFQTVALARAGASEVMGVDINPIRLKHGRGMAKTPVARFS
jgi:2-polyprenyl-3-methyl-5-hydroxy-6-metoxy-1,4-benzoquinol methylase